MLFVGEKPGREEDREDENFIGQIGDYLRKVYLRYLRVHTEGVPLDVYAVNAVRCAPPIGGDATNPCVKACRSYLTTDLENLSKHYERLIVVACGGPACQALTGETFGKASRRQGQPLSGYSNVTFFATRNPGLLLPGRDPSAIRTIEEHLGLVCDFIKHNRLLKSEVTTYRLPMVISRLPDSACRKTKILSLDIETYGSLDGKNQTQFSPLRSVKIDGITNHDDLITTVACSWYNDSGGVSSAVWIWPDQKDQFYAFIESAIKQGYSVLGKNLAFDLMYLRFCDRRLRTLLARKSFAQYGVRALELGVASFLENDKRIEMSLKDVARVLKIHAYNEDHSLRGGFRYSDRYDAELLDYCVEDTVVTLLCWTELVKRTRKRWRTTAKFSDYSLGWYNDCIWSVIAMTEGGFLFDSRDLRKRLRSYQRRADKFYSYVWTRWGYSLSNENVRVIGGAKGASDFPKSAVIQAVNEAKLSGDRRLKRNKTGISCDKGNMNLLLDCLHPKSEARLKLRFLLAFRKAQKVIGTFITPLFEDPKDRLIPIRDGTMIANPTWFITPAMASDDSDETGGTCQGRWTCSRYLTYPRKLMKTIVSRYSPGFILGADGSQEELRVAAILSGDPVMMEEYRLGLDKHAATAKRVFGDEVEQRADWDDYRQLGKILNFLRLFRGGWFKYIESVRAKLGIEITREKAEADIAQYNRIYDRLRIYQDGLIAQAKKRGYLEVPLIGTSRSFLGTNFAIEETYISTICNFQVQEVASRIVQSAQRLLLDQFEERGLRTKIVLNIYDALYFDGPAEEEDEVRALIPPAMNCPPYYKALQSLVGREVPLACDLKILSRRLPA